jgi:hypothetical protein
MPGPLTSKRRDITGAADKAVNLVGVSPHTTNCLGGWLAYPMHAVAMKHVLFGRKSLRCLAAISRSGRNDRGDPMCRTSVCRQC